MWSFVTKQNDNTKQKYHYEIIPNTPHLVKYNTDRLYIQPYRGYRRCLCILNLINGKIEHTINTINKIVNGTSYQQYGEVLAHDEKFLFKTTCEDGVFPRVYDLGTGIHKTNEYYKWSSQGRFIKSDHHKNNYFLRIVPSFEPTHIDIYLVFL